MSEQPAESGTPLPSLSSFAVEMVENLRREMSKVLDEIREEAEDLRADAVVLPHYIVKQLLDAEPDQCFAVVERLREELRRLSHSDGTEGARRRG